MKGGIYMCVYVCVKGGERNEERGREFQITYETNGVHAFLTPLLFRFEALHWRDGG